MKTLEFYGSSDDTFGEYNYTGYDVDNCASGKPIQCVLECGVEKMMVVGQYSRNKNSCWDVGICQVEENINIPNWAISFFQMDIRSF